MYVMFLFLLSSFYCAASDGVSENLSQYVLYPKETDPEYDVCERVRRHRRNSFCKALQSVLQEGAGPGHPTVAVEKLKWVVKGRVRGEGGVLHPDGKPILRYPEGGITPGEEVAAWPACLFTGSEYPSQSEEARFAEFIDTVRFWGGKETKTHPTQGVQSAAIAALINENYAKDLDFSDIQDKFKETYEKYEELRNLILPEKRSIGFEK